MLCGGPVGARPYPIVDAGGTYSQYLRAPFAYRRHFPNVDLVVDVRDVRARERYQLHPLAADLRQPDPERDVVASPLLYVAPVPVITGSDDVSRDNLFSCYERQLISPM